jgi:DNA (cytosine-5)-methyltransferase 1
VALRDVVGLFAGIGGIELGFERARVGLETVLLCECWEPAKRVLGQHFKASVHPDVTRLRHLPANSTIVTAGFPCTDLSQAGRTAGIRGRESSLVGHVFRLVGSRLRGRHKLDWLVIENVPNMLALDRGEAMRYLTSELEDLGLRWAYRVVDARFAGLPQRRRRVLLVASATEDPRDVLFSEDAGPRGSGDLGDDAFGFYWTEGLRGLGWAVDAVPTLKGGSGVGIPSPPGIWVPEATAGKSLVVPGIDDAEALQGFPRGWTESADRGGRNGPRWKLVGNAVAVGVSFWLARALAQPGRCGATSTKWEGGKAWPSAAWGENRRVHQVDVSEFPRNLSYRHLSDVICLDAARPLSHRGAKGFLSRLLQGNLGRHPGFREAVAEHVKATQPAEGDLKAVC